MAERRMFAKTIIDSDAFLDMPLSTQALYFHLSMRADDDGFINNPKKIQRTVGCSDDDLKLLIVKRFVILFESGVVVIKHWKIHNYIRNDRYKPTVYSEEKELLECKGNGAYTLGIPNDSQVVYQMETQVSIGKDRLGKDSLGESIDDPQADTPALPEDESPKKPKKFKCGEYKRVLLTQDELEKLTEQYGAYNTGEAIKFLDEYIEMKGYKVKSHYLALKRWVFDAVTERANKVARQGSAQHQAGGNPFYEMYLAETEGEIIYDEG